MDYCAASISAVSFGHLLKRAMGVPNNHALFTETSKDEETSEDCDKQLEQRKNQLKRESNKLQMSPIKSISKVTASEVNESPLSKSVPHDRLVFLIIFIFFKYYLIGFLPKFLAVYRFYQMLSNIRYIPLIHFFYQNKMI